VTSPGREQLARTAYEAHRAAHSATLPSWDDLAEDERQSWREAVSAVPHQTAKTKKTVAEAAPARPRQRLAWIRSLRMKFRRKAKLRVTGVSFPVIGGGVTWSDSADERTVRARTERADAFAELWNIAQEAHIGIRNNFDNVDGLADVHRQLNILLIRKAPVLDPADVELAQNFLSAVGEFIHLLRPMTGPSADRMRQRFSDTMAEGELFVPDDLDVLHEALSRMSSYDEALTRRYRELVFGETS
jgi:hypothetical protein